MASTPPRVSPLVYQIIALAVTASFVFSVWADAYVPGYDVPRGLYVLMAGLVGVSLGRGQRRE